MINQIHKIALVTDDVEGAVRFYTQTLGLEVMERFPVEDDEDYVFLKAGDFILELMPKKSMQAEEGFHHISFRVDSVDACAQELKEKGVQMEKEPFDAGAGGIRLAFFKGPNDVPLQLFEQNQEGGS
ncbi:MAG: VOC family protein [Candidatus Poribacteria bacterium]|nr:VOC family protein [Candidatus Poribacteria bacterium]